MQPFNAPAPGGTPVPTEALSTEVLDAILDAMLSAQPPPYVAAVAEIGLCVPMPPEAPVRSELRITGTSSLLELCRSADMGAVIAAWESARVVGHAQTVVRLRSAPTNPVTFHFIDARHRYGVYFGIMVDAPRALAFDAKKSEIFRPRICTMERNELAVVLSVDSAVEQILGWPAAKLVGERSTHIIHPDDRPLSVGAWLEMLSRPGFDHRITVRYRHADGRYMWFEVTNRNLLGDPENPRVATQLLDVSERMEAVEKLRMSEELLRQLTETLPQGVAHIDQARKIVYHTERLLEIVGVEQITTLDDLIETVTGGDRRRFRAAADALLANAQPVDMELTIGHGNGARRCSLGMRALTAGRDSVCGAILSLTDVTERERLRQEIERRARFDQLTSCLNRDAILETLAEALERNHAANSAISVLFIDLDGFKQVNDEFGHAAGDALLRCVGERLVNGTRPGDAVGRLGGDEFLVVAHDLETAQSALEVARRLALSLAAPADAGGRTFRPGASIGVAWTDGVVDADALVARADAAMYESKRRAAGPMLWQSRFSAPESAKL